MSKNQQSKSNDLVGDESPEIILTLWQPRKVHQGQIVKFVKNGNQPNELLEYAAIVSSVKNEVGATLSVVTDTHLEFLKNVPQSKEPMAGYFYVK